MQSLQSTNALGELVLITNVLLILVAPFMIQRVYHEASGSTGFTCKVHLLRALNLLIIIAVLVYFFGIHLDDENGQSWIMKGIGVLIIVYVAYLCSHLIEIGVYEFNQAVASLPKTRQQILEAILNTSIEQGISLSRPLTHRVENRRDDPFA